ncbi:hypothetical protein [Cohnella soli]|uniref:Uncharacterized protein n=1 Tax=Cohnella soli TaxID=425005 RepID=A0ABW0HPN9_9BACL
MVIGTFEWSKDVSVALLLDFDVLVLVRWSDKGYAHWKDVSVDPDGRRFFKWCGVNVFMDHIRAS